MFTVKLITKFYIMLKSILKLNGAQGLTKSEQKSINGGAILDIVVCEANECNRFGKCTTQCR